MSFFRNRTIPDRIMLQKFRISGFAMWNHIKFKVFIAQLSFKTKTRLSRSISSFYYDALLITESIYDAVHIYIALNFWLGLKRVFHNSNAALQAAFIMLSLILHIFCIFLSPSMYAIIPCIAHS